MGEGHERAAARVGHPGFLSELAARAGRGGEVLLDRSRDARSQLAASRPPRRSSVLLLVAGTDLEDSQLVLEERGHSLRSQPGQFALPGGGADPGDRDEVHTALREAQEETGLDPSGIEILGALPKAPVPVSGHDVTPVVGWWTRPSAVDVVDHAESSLVFRVPVLDLVDPDRRHTAEVTREGANRPTLRHRSPAFRVPRQITDPVGGADEVVVWGFTGILLDRVLEAAGWARPWPKDDVRPAPLG